MHKINFGFDSLLATIKEKSGNKRYIYSIAGYDRRDYVNPAVKHFRQQSDNDDYDLSFFSQTKSDTEKKFDITFPIVVDEQNCKELPLSVVHRSEGFESTDTRMFSKLKETKVIKNTVDYFLKSGEKFIYPYYVLNEISLQEDIPLPPTRVIQAAKEGKCKIAFFYGNEGHTYSMDKLDTVVNFTKKINTVVYFYSSNLILNERYSGWLKSHPNRTTPLLKFPDYSAFEFDPWFITLDRTDKAQQRLYFNNYFSLVEDHKIVKNIINVNNNKKFLIFNRRPRLLRTLMHAAVKADPQLNFHTYTGIEKDVDIDSKLSHLHYQIMQMPDRLNIFEYIKQNKDTYRDTGYELDVNLEENQAFSFPLSFYFNSFISVVTETETQEDCVFFSEKIFKPIVGLHPFIVVSSPFFLRKLKDHGYKTFSNFWDESYDEIEGIMPRFEAILKVIEDLNTRSIPELNKMYQEMEVVLKHNYFHFFENQRHINTLNELTNFRSNLI